MNGSSQNNKHLSEQAQEANDCSAPSPWALFALLYPEVFIGLFLGKSFVKSIETVAGSLQSDHRNDPTYKKKLQELIERNREFEKSE